MKKTLSGIMQTLLLISMITLAFNIQLVKASGTIYIMADGSIDPSTAPISTVDNVTYTFTDNIYASIKVQKSSIIIDGNEYTLQGDGTNDGFYLYRVNNVTIKKTNISNFKVGVWLWESHYDNVVDNNITNSWNNGVMIVYSNNTTVNGNSIVNSGWSGGWIELSNHTRVTSNTISDNNGMGIFMDDSLGNIIEDNTISDNNDVGISLYDSLTNVTNNVIDSNRHGIWLQKSSNNFIEENKILKNQGYGIFVDEKSGPAHIIGNDVKNNGYGIQLNASDCNTITCNDVANNTGYGIYLIGYPNSPCNYNNIENNIVEDNTDRGIYLFYNCNHNTVSYNNVANNTRGISMTWSFYNTLTDNNITRNTMYGIELVAYCYGNKIYLNNFVDNTNQTHIENSPSNTWDSGYLPGGNYWSDYAGKDEYKGPNQNIPGSDGIGDTPYKIDHSNTPDYYPLKPPYPSHDIGIIVNKEQKGNIVGQGYNLSIVLTMLNYGIYPENLNVTVYVTFYANKTVHANTTIFLSRSFRTLTFTWNTTGYAKGNYTIWAYATPVQGETDTTDNTFTDGWVMIAMVGDIASIDKHTGKVVDIPDGKVDIVDIAKIARLFGVIYPDPKYDANCDLNNDLKIDIKDIATVAKQYGKIDP
jgi:parallel beta-helix repeat protein